MKAKIASCKDPEMDPNSRTMERAIPGINKRLKHVVDSITESKFEVCRLVEGVGMHVVDRMNGMEDEVEEVKEDVREVREDIKLSLFFVVFLFDLFF